MAHTRDIFTHNHNLCGSFLHCPCLLSPFQLSMWPSIKPFVHLKTSLKLPEVVLIGLGRCVFISSFPFPFPLHFHHFHPFTFCSSSFYLFLIDELVCVQVPEEEISEKGDIFCFGIVLFELIIRRRLPSELKKNPSPNYPFNTELLKALIATDCPPQFVDLAHQCCEVNSAHRPNAKEAVRVLKGKREEKR